MINSKYFSISKLVAILALFVVISSCKKDLDGLEPATFPSIGDVFIDGFSSGLEYAAFGGSDVTGFQVVSDVTYEGDAAMRFAVPDVGDPAGSYVGGTYFVEGGRDLSGFNALTFWAKATTNATIDEIGFGVDLGEDKYVATLEGGAQVNTNWKQFILPLPDASVLTQEKGMFFYAEGPENGNGYTFWIDEVKFERLENLGQSESGIQSKQDVTVQAETGQDVTVTGLVQTTILPTGVNVGVAVSPAYFDFTSSNTSVATVNSQGVAMVLDAGSSTITAKLGGEDALGSLTIEGTGEAVLPTQSPTQTRSADSVIALWSNDYEERPVDTWNARYEFSTAEEQFIDVDGDDIIRYRMLNFVGIEFKTPTIDVSEMTHFHINIWTPDETGLPNDFKVLLADAGPDNTLGTGDDTNDELTFTAPLLQTEEWVTIEIPLSNFTGLASRTNLVQMVLSGSLPNVFIDNVYFYIAEVDPPVLPTTGGPAPTQAPEDVISIYSDSYTDVPNVGFNLYGAAAFEGVNFGPDDNALKYTLTANPGGNFQVLELGGANQIDAAGAGMTNFRFDLFFPNAGVEAAEFLVKVVDFGTDPPPTANITVNSASSPAIAQGTWLQFDFTLAELAGLGMTSAGNVQQVVFDLLSSGQAYVDNIYFYKEGGGTVCDPPMDPSLTTLPIDFEDCADFTGVFESGDGVTGFPAANPDQTGANTSATVYQFNKVVGSAWYSGIFHNFPSTYDLTTTKVFKMKIWSPKPNIIVRFQVEKEGGGAVTYQKTATTGAANTWTELEFDFSDQPFIDGFTPYDKIVIIPDDQDNGPADGSIYYLDDIELTTGGGGGGDMPPTAGAPAPTETNVISIYSDAYTDEPRDGFAFYGAAAFEEVNFGTGDNALKYTFVDVPGGNFQVIELGGANQIDAMGAGMTNFRFDLYFPKEGVESEQFLLKLVDASNFGQTADITINNAVPGPTIAQGTWINFDFTIAELMSTYNLPGAAAIQQVVIDLLSSGEVYVDNIYFYGEGGGGGDMPPTTGAPAPTEAEADVISIYSDAYTDEPRDGFAFYGAAAFEEVNFGTGDNALKYTFVDVPGGNFQVIELGGANQIDAMGAGMTNFRFDLYFPKEGVESEQFLLKLVDASNFGQTADITINNAVPGPTIAQGTWINFDFTIAELMSTYNLPGAAAIQQVVIDLLSSGEVYVDNIYFYGEGGGGGDMPPTTGAPAPTEAEADVISIYSDAYTDEPRDGFNFYGAAAFEEVNFGASDNALRYTFVDVPGGNFQVIELGGANQIDAMGAGMTNFRFDLYFPKEGVESEQFLLKLVDASNFGQTADITINNAVPGPTIAQGTWINFDFTIAELMSTYNLPGAAAIQQVVIDLLSSGEVYVDNIYFYGSGGGGGDMPPSTGAPAPTEAEADVISIYSDAYTDEPRDGFNFYGAAAFEEVNFGTGDNALRYTFVDVPGGNFQVIELGGANQIDAMGAGMTNFRFDLYFPKEGVESEQFLLKLVDASNFGQTADITINNAVPGPTIAQGTWINFDFTIAELMSTYNLPGAAAIQQVVIDLLSSGEVYVDNIYFYGSGGGSNACDPPMDPSLTTSFPIDFENCEDLSFVFEGPLPEGFPTTDFPTGNASTGVYQFNKAGPWFAGIGHTFSAPFDMTTQKKFTLKIWSSKPNVVIRFAIEKNGNPGSPPSYIDRQTLVSANTWTTLTFDFSDEVFSGGTTGYDQIIIIPDDAGDGSPDVSGDVYYIDDIQQTN